jgi:hypothetical protein
MRRVKRPVKMDVWSDYEERKNKRGDQELTRSSERV